MAGHCSLFMQTVATQRNRVSLDPRTAAAHRVRPARDLARTPALIRHSRAPEQGRCWPARRALTGGSWPMQWRSSEIMMVKSLKQACSEPRPLGMAEGPWRLQLEQRHEPVPAGPSL